LPHKQKTKEDDPVNKEIARYSLSMERVRGLAAASNELKIPPAGQLDPPYNSLQNKILVQS
jgi:hypothetical protein